MCLFRCRESQDPNVWPGFLRHLVVTCESCSVTERHAILCFAGSQSCWVLSQGICCSILCMNTITHWILTTWPKHTTTVRTYTVNAVHLHKSISRYIAMLYICLSLQCLWRDKCVLDSTGCWLKQEGMLGQRLKPLWSITVKTPSHSVWSALTTSSGGTLQGCLSVH